MAPQISNLKTIRLETDTLARVFDETLLFVGDEYARADQEGR